MGRLIKIGIVLTATLFVVESIVIRAAWLTHRDPFAPYLALMLGRSIDALKDDPCRFIIAKTTNRQIGTCEFPTDRGPFGQITLTAYDHIITQTYFSVQAEQLHFGDLSLCWGKPSLETDGSSAQNWVVRWGSEVSTDVTLAHGSADVSNFLPIQYLIIEGEWLPCHSA